MAEEKFILDDYEIKTALLGDPEGRPYYIEKMQSLRDKIEELSASLDDSTALENVELFPNWSADASYTVGDRTKYGLTLYKCLTAHQSQSAWTPPDSPSLWARVDDPTIEWPEWVQPVGSTDAYMAGDKVSHNNKHWISDVDNNVWEPGVYGWTEV